jgi:hypothetical protein
MPKSRPADLGALAAALRDSGWKFRTAEGIAADLGMAPADIARILAGHPEVARKSALTDRAGRELYAAADSPVTLRERLEQVRWILAH